MMCSRVGFVVETVFSLKDGVDEAGMVRSYMIDNNSEYFQCFLPLKGGEGLGTKWAAISESLTWKLEHECRRVEWEMVI